MTIICLRNVAKNFTYNYHVHIIDEYKPQMWGQHVYIINEYKPQMWGDKNEDKNYYVKTSSPNNMPWKISGMLIYPTNPKHSFSTSMHVILSIYWHKRCIFWNWEGSINPQKYAIKAKQS